MVEESAVQCQQPYTWDELRRVGLCVIFPELDGHRYIIGSKVRVPHLELLTRANSGGSGEELFAIRLTFSAFSTKSNLFIIDRIAHGDVHRLARVNFPREVPDEVLRSTLLAPIVINSEQYSFLCSSASGMRAPDLECYLWRGDRDARAAVLDELGLFSSIRSASKQLARPQLLFTRLRHVCIPSTMRVAFEEDISVPNRQGGHYLFTDGCGRIGIELARRIAEKTKYVFFFIATTY